LGTTLGEAGVNVATFHLGRNQAGGDAIALIQVDQPVADGLLEKVRAIPNVVQVKALGF
jgi:D-3-phosphoglycerate dehydrogenase